MIRAWSGLLTCAAVLLLLPGCWSKHELKELGLIVGWGMDLNKEGAYVGSAQIAIPSRISLNQSGGEESHPFITLSAKGSDILEAAAAIQNKTSRFLFAGHRQNIFIGDELARHGLKSIIDEYSRNPNVRLRTDIFVVKGGRAEDILNANQPFEREPAQEFNMIYRTIGALRLNSFLYLLQDASEPGSCMSIAAFSPDRKIDDYQIYEWAGESVFNEEMKLVGYLNTKESQLLMWMQNRQKTSFSYTLPVQEEGANASMDIQFLKGRIDSSVKNNRPAFHVKLSGEAFLRENESNVNLSTDNELDKLEKKLNQFVKKDAEKMIGRVQKRFRSDILHFGRQLHREHPLQWERMVATWNSVYFPNSEVTVETHIVLSKIGLTGSPQHLKRRQVLP